MTRPSAEKDTNSIYVNDADGIVTGNLLENDIKGDGDTLYLRFLDGVRIAESGKYVNNTVVGDYGTFTIYSDGSYTYDLDETNPAVMALTSGQRLVEQMTYKIIDNKGLTDVSSLTLEILGPNTAPTAVDDHFAVADPEVSNSVSGNLLANDLDESVASLEVARAGHDGLSFVPGNGSLTVEGVYGTLEIARDGSFTYTVNLEDPDYVALNGATAVEEFDYRVRDEAFGEVPNSNSTDYGHLYVTVNGSGSEEVLS